MARKRLTQLFPFILPLRVWQRKLFFYTRMRFDGQIYSKTRREDRCEYTVFETKNPLYNNDTGFDMVYQHNKVFNLMLAAKKLDGLLIQPGETFSFWQAIRRADRYTPYKDGLTVQNGKLIASKGGGLCQMSNLLFWVFLHSPLTIVERHTHDIKDFPTARDGEPEGVDATVSEGWRDLKVKNETDKTFQIAIAFDAEYISAVLLSDRALPYKLEILGKDLAYSRRGDKVYQKIAIYRRQIGFSIKGARQDRLLYENICQIGYQLPVETLIEEGA